MGFVNCHIAARIRDVRSHGSPSTRRVIRGGKNQISGNQRVSVRRTDCVHEGQIHSTDHLLFRSALNLETESAGRARRRRPRHRWWMGLASNSFVYTCPRAPFPQLNNCIHIHPSVRPSVLSTRSATTVAFLRFPSLNPFAPSSLPLAILLANQTRHRKISPRSNLRSNCTSTTRSAELGASASCKTADTWCLIRSNCARRNGRYTRWFACSRRPAKAIFRSFG